MAHIRSCFGLATSEEAVLQIGFRTGSNPRSLVSCPRVAPPSMEAEVRKLACVRNIKYFGTELKVRLFSNRESLKH